MALPTPHLEKLNATLANDKLPPADKQLIEAAIGRYNKWIADLKAVTGTPQKRIRAMVALLNEYRQHIDVELVFRQPAGLPLPPEGPTQTGQQRH